MTTAPTAGAFERFAARRGGDIRRIARATRGELEPGDVLAEAWLMADAMTGPDGEPFDLDGPDAHKALLARLYQQLVKYTELNVRHAVRLDHGAAGSDEGAVHPLMHRLVSDGGRGPLDELAHRESAVDEEAALDGSGSLAVAWVRLMRCFRNRMGDVAGHLMISTSWAYRRCARARSLAIHQHPMTAQMMPPDFMPGPWRPFPVLRSGPGRQLEFDFDDELAFTA